MFDGHGMSLPGAESGGGAAQDAVGGTGPVGPVVMPMVPHRIRPRWLYPLVVALSLLTICSGPVGAVGVWFVRETAAVSPAGKSPYDAAYGVVSSLGRWQPEDLAGTERYVMPGRWDDISERLLEMRRLLAGPGQDYFPQMSNARTVEDGGFATVTVDVAMEYTVQNNGHILFQTSSALPWTFRTVHVFGLVNGWKVDGFDNPEPFCATYC